MGFARDVQAESPESAEPGPVTPGPPVFGGGDTGLEVGLAHVDLL